MPSFDVVSEVDNHELTNAVDQANREVDNRFDFKGTNAKFVLKDSKITLTAPTEFHIQQMQDIMKGKLAKRQIDVRCLELGEILSNLAEARMVITVKQGIDKEFAKKIVNLVKDAKLKVQSQIQGEQVRITGKNRDDLQTAIAHLRNAELELPLQFNNFRD